MENILKWFDVQESNNIFLIKVQFYIEISLQTQELSDMYCNFNIYSSILLAFWD